MHYMVTLILYPHPSSPLLNPPHLSSPPPHPSSPLLTPPHRLLTPPHLSSSLLTPPHPSSPPPHLSSPSPSPFSPLFTSLNSSLSHPPSLTPSPLVSFTSFTLFHLLLQGDACRFCGVVVGGGWTDKQVHATTAACREEAARRRKRVREEIGRI